MEDRPGKKLPPKGEKFRSLHVPFANRPQMGKGRKGLKWKKVLLSAIAQPRPGVFPPREGVVGSRDHGQRQVILMVPTVEINQEMKGRTSRPRKVRRFDAVIQRRRSAVKPGGGGGLTKNWVLKYRKDRSRRIRGTWTLRKKKFKEKAYLLSGAPPQRIPVSLPGNPKKSGGEKVSAKSSIDQFLTKGRVER